LALAAAFALLIFGAFFALQRPAVRDDGANTLAVMAVRGTVTGMIGGERQALSAGQAATVGSDGTLETSSSGAARIRAGGGLVVELGEKTKVSLRELSTSRESSALRLESGTIRCVVDHDPSRTFTVVTPDARVVDVGTVFTVTVEPSPNGRTTSVQVEEGKVVVHHGGKQLPLTPFASSYSGPRPLADMVTLRLHRRMSRCVAGWRSIWGPMR
jgi:ferric-dicitrate binding protein FerR (iron transport regulator)